MRKTRYVWVCPCALLLGVLALYFSTPHGAGVSADSCVYMGAAEAWAKQGELLNGPGPGIPVDEALVHYPPLYPLTLDLLSRGTSIADYRSAARWINLLSLVVVVTLVPVLMRRVDGAAVTAMTLIVTGGGLLDAAGMVWSELPFLALLMGTMVLLRRTLEPGAGWVSALASGVLVSLLYLTRYAGAAAGAAGLLLILLFGRRAGGVTLRKAAAFIVGATMGPVAWGIRNAAVLGGESSRGIVWHPPGFWHLSTGLDTLLEWLAPHGEASVGVGAIRGLMLVPLCVACAWMLWRRRSDVAASDTHLATMCGVFVVAYLGLVLVSACFLDALTPFDARLMLPVYVMGVIGAVDLLSRALASSVRLRRWGVWACVVGCVAGVPPLYAHVSLRHTVQPEFSAESWRENEVLRWFWAGTRSYPFDRYEIRSNAPDLIYAVAQRRYASLPQRMDPFSERPNADYERELAELGDGRVPRMVIFFDGFGWRREQATENEVAGVDGMQLWYDGPGTRVYKNYGKGASGKVRGGGN